MRTIELRGEMGRCVIVAIHGYEREGPQDNSYDANWLRCSLSADMGAFRGEAEASLTTNDFARFSSEIERLTTGAASSGTFTTMEEWLALRIDIDRAGRAKIAGSLRGSDSIPPTLLSFSFESDLSFLRQLEGELRRVVEEFPIR